MSDFPDQDIVWADLDSKFQRYPEMFDKFTRNGQYDAAFCYSPFKRRKGGKLFCAVMWLRNVSITRRFIDLAIEEDKKDYENGENFHHDQFNCDQVLKRWGPESGFNTGVIPYSECCIFDLKPTAGAAIIQTQASRRNKRLPPREKASEEDTENAMKAHKTRSPRLACEAAKKIFPNKPGPKDSEIVHLQWLMIKSRRKGLTKEEFLEYKRIAERNSEEISRWHERWLCSLFDTFAENGEGVFLIFSAIRMMEKMHCPAQKGSMFGRTFAVNNPDIHTNLIKRIKNLTSEDSYTWPMIRSLIRQIETDQKSILGKLAQITAKRPTSSEMNRILK
jgi:hypothetical protein